MDEPAAALGVKQAGEALELVRRTRGCGLAVVVISRNVPQVSAIADGIHVMRLGRRAAAFRLQDTTMTDVVAIMTGTLAGTEQAAPADRAEPGMLTS